MVVIAWEVDFHLSIQSVSIITKVDSWFPKRGGVHLLQANVINFVNDLRQVAGLFPSTPVSSTNITEYIEIIV